jgi:hypothetical protein
VSVTRSRPEIRPRGDERYLTPARRRVPPDSRSAYGKPREQAKSETAAARIVGVGGLPLSRVYLEARRKPPPDDHNTRQRGSGRDRLLPGFGDWGPA